MSGAHPITQLLLRAIRSSIILLAYSQVGGLEGFALQGMIFLVLLFASEAGKQQHQKKYARGPAAPTAPLAS